MLQQMWIELEALKANQANQSNTDTRETNPDDGPENQLCQAREQAEAARKLAEDRLEKAKVEHKQDLKSQEIAFEVKCINP